MDILYEKLYEDRDIEIMNEERFLKLTDKYEDEQLELSTQIKHFKSHVDKESTSELNDDKFIDLIKKHTQIKAVTAEILRDFISHIVVHHREKTKSGYEQKIEIYFNFIGEVNLPNYFEQEQFAKTFARHRTPQQEKRSCNDIYNLFSITDNTKQYSQKQKCTQL